MTEEEKEAIEQEFQYALDEILSLVKGETATAIVVKEQSMILLFKKLLLKIDKLQKENEQFKRDISNMYDEEVIVNILEDRFNLNRGEVLEILGEEESNYES